MGLWKTLLTVGKGIKTGVLGLSKTSLTVAGAGTAGYFGWQYLVNDKPVAKTAGSILIGEETVDKVSDTIGGAVEGVSSIARSTTDAITSVTNTVASVNNTVANVNSAMESAEVPVENTTGFGNFLQSMLSGNGTGMLGSFINNIANGRVSGMSYIGLIGAALMIFGRFGWIGKILGALLGMTILGNNINMNAVMAGSQAQTLGQGVATPRQSVEPSVANGIRR